MLTVLIAGLILGVPLGWAVLFCAFYLSGRDKRPPTKDEWKVM